MNIRKILAVQEIKHDVKSCRFDAKALQEDSGRDATIDRSELSKDWSSLAKAIQTAHLNNKINISDTVGRVSDRQAINGLHSLISALKHLPMFKHANVTV